MREFWIGVVCGVGLVVIYSWWVLRGKGYF